MEKFESPENNERLEDLTNQLAFSSIRLMVDPRAMTLSSKAVIDDICLFLEEELNPNPQYKPFVSFGSKK